MLAICQLLHQICFLFTINYILIHDTIAIIAVVQRIDVQTDFSCRQIIRRSFDTDKVVDAIVVIIAFIFLILRSNIIDTYLLTVSYCKMVY